MRPCKATITEYVKGESSGGWIAQKRDIVGLFHKWGLLIQEQSDGAPNISYSVAIIEGADGKIEMATPDTVVFTDGLYDDDMKSLEDQE